MGKYRHEAVELSGLNHLAEAEILLLNGTSAGLAGGSRRLGIFYLPWLLGVRHFHLNSTLCIKMRRRTVAHNHKHIYTVEGMLGVSEIENL